MFTTKYGNNNYRVCLMYGFCNKQTGSQHVERVCRNSPIDKVNKNISVGIYDNWGKYKPYYIVKYLISCC